MKKPYSEPDIYFESFALSTSIAAGCEEKTNTDREGCGVRFGNSIVFAAGIAENCSGDTKEGENEYGNLCYHNPTDDSNVFFS